jgi:hypothetical protein
MAGASSPAKSARLSQVCEIGGGDVRCFGGDRPQLDGVPGSTSVPGTLGPIRRLGLLQVCGSSDCKTVVSEIKEGTMGCYAAINIEICSRSEHFEACSLIHEGRASNYEADNLAKHTLSSGVGRHMRLNIPYSSTIPVNVMIDE